MPEGLDVRVLLEKEGSGVLATLSARRDGWPFASVAPYALTDTGEPLLLLSRLAEHTRNLLADGRASLLVQDQASLTDPQAGARITILGTVEIIVATVALECARGHYVKRHPRAADYLALGDFELYVLRVREARFVGGFGDMGWIDAERWRDILTLS